MILFEGVDGAGKTFAMEKLTEELERKEIPVTIVSSIPYETFIMSHDSDWFDLSITNIKYIEYLSWQVNNYYLNIKDQIRKGVVLVDRYIPSCYAYNELSDDTYTNVLHDMMSNMAKNFFKPDITFYFEVPDNVLIDRHNKTTQPEKMTNMKYINKVKNRYDEFFSKFPYVCKKINGDQDIRLTVTQMVDSINKIGRK